MKEGQPGQGKKKIRNIAGACVALSTAAITARATHDVYVSTGVEANSAFAWLAPLGIEGGSVFFAILLWEKSTKGEKAKELWFGMIYCLAMSMLVNLYRVDPTMMALSHFKKIEAVFFPGLLVLVAHALFEANKDEQKKRRQVAAVSRPATTKAPAPKPPVAPAPVLVDERPKPVLEAAPTTTTRGKGSPHNETVDALLAENPSITGKAVGEHLGVSDQHGRRLLAAAKKRRDGEAA